MSKWIIFNPDTEAGTGGVLQKKLVLEISQKSQENTSESLF